jgi:oligopeptide transport system ATP-binding protein
MNDASRHNGALLEVSHLKKYFPVKRGLFSHVIGQVRAVDDISFSIRRKETLGLVGESGCGKTTAGRTILRLLEPTSGEVRFDGRPVFELRREALRRLRRDMQVIFQDPYGSLNPRMTVGNIVGEALSVHGVARGAKRRAIVKELLEKVGLEASHVNRYPHEFSGGQRQRIGIARALALRPKFIVCDEPVSALDVSIQAQIINLLEQLQDEFELSYLFIAHDLAVVEHISDRVAVMYLGEIVELAASEALYATPLHPYTEALLSAIPVPDPRTKAKRIILPGDVPSPMNPPPGCRFHPRCPKRFEPCDGVPPPLEEVSPGHWVACYLHCGKGRGAQ